MAYDLHSEFDIQKHKEAFTNYLEVVIDEKGKVHYAIPSHQEKLVSMACERTGLTREQISDLCPKSYYCSYHIWLALMAHAVPVWNDWCDADVMNKKQVQALRKLKLVGLYHGNVPLSLPSKYPEIGEITEEKFKKEVVL